MRCQDKERLITYLYGEDTAADREAVEAHLARCGDCDAEVDGLRAARGGLAEWQAPDVALGFRLVREPARPAWRRWPLPVWAALPAAAALVLAAGAAIAHLEVRYDRDGVTVRSGWQRTLPAVAPAPQAIATAPATPRDDAWKEALAETERRLRAEFASAGAPAKPAPPASPPAAAAFRMDPAQVRALIEASERRQQRELALRITEVVQDIEAQRRADLVQIDENLGHIEGQTAARQREVMNYLVRVAEGR
jgi:hypothetical protein